MARLRVLFFVCVCLLCAGVARADDGGWLEWIEKMSGPGPFWGAGAYVRFYCWNKEHKGAVFCWRNPDKPEGPQRPENERHILELGAGYFKTFDGKPRFFDTPSDTKTIHLLRVEPRYYYRFHRAVDAGFGFGLRRYSGEGFPSFTQGSFTPASIVFVPFAVTESDSDNPWRRFLKLHLEETYIGGVSAATDFKSASTYKTNGEFLSSFSVEFDVLVFLKGYQGLKGVKKP